MLVDTTESPEYDDNDDNDDVFISTKTTDEGEGESSEEYLDSTSLDIDTTAATNASWPLDWWEEFIPEGFAFTFSLGLEGCYGVCEGVGLGLIWDVANQRMFLSLDSILLGINYQKGVHVFAETGFLLLEDKHLTNTYLDLGWQFDLWEDANTSVNAVQVNVMWNLGHDTKLLPCGLTLRYDIFGVGSEEWPCHKPYDSPELLDEGNVSLPAPQLPTNETVSLITTSLNQGTEIFSNDTQEEEEGSTPTQAELMTTVAESLPNGSVSQPPTTPNLTAVEEGQSTDLPSEFPLTSIIDLPPWFEAPYCEGFRVSLRRKKVLAKMDCY
ncbi:hypothetical protein RFI_18738, partial [Reticulomyxa filosa]